jgi:delta(3,5)-delta(2,4)-dienoyl-CoA isomerase
MAADIGTLQMFPFVTNSESFFRDIVYTGRYFDAKEALNCGFVSKVVKDHD